MKKDSSTLDFPAWSHLLGPMGPRSFSSTLSKVRRATLAQIEERLAPWLPASLLEKHRPEQERERIFTTPRTFWCFLWQMLQGNTSCREVLLQLIALFKLQGGSAVDENTSGYCQARPRLPLPLLEEALEASAQAAGQRAPQGPLLQGRAIKAVDGSSNRLADTPENQKRFPQPTNQKAGCGFPVMRIVVLFCASSGAILAKAIDSLWKSELKLAATLLGYLRKGDILLADRHFGNFTILALLPLLAEGVDLIARVATGSRRVDFRKGQRLGKNDRLFVWKKRARTGRWLKKKLLVLLPDEITVRVLRVCVIEKGFRARTLTLMTTLLDAKLYPAHEIAAAYLRRWRLEMCLDDLKTTLGLEKLKCLTPDMAEKELLAGLIAHNLLRALMAEAARTHGVDLDRISFKGCLDCFRQFSAALCQARTRKGRLALWAQLLKTLAADQVPHRPGRREPRAVKRRCKYQKLTRPRALQKDRPLRHSRKTASKRRRALN